MSNSCRPGHDVCVEEIFQRIASDLSMITDRALRIEGVETRIANFRPVGAGQIHISFRMGFRVGQRRFHGCLLVPLPEAITLACGLMMVPEQTVLARRSLPTLDGSTKDAMIVVGNFITAATEGAVRALELDAGNVVFEGCQGVRPNVRPALVYDEGSALVVGRARALLEGFPAVDLILMVPAEVLPCEPQA